MTRLRLALFLTLGLSGGCVVHGRATVAVSGGTTVVPMEPPQEQAEPVEERRGFIWVKGHWAWQNNAWAWVGGHWERERAGYNYTQGHWERHDTKYHWIEGTWVAGGAVTEPTRPAEIDHRTEHVPTPPPEHHEDNGAYPTSAPPALRVENYGAPKAGFVWIGGRWDWRNGQWAWIDGHWERARASETWVPGRWELQGSYYVWIDGHWAAGGSRPVERDHRK